VSNSLYNKLLSYNISLTFINIYKYTYINKYACMHVLLQALVFVLTFLSLDCFQRQSEKIWTSRASLMKGWFLSLDKIMKFASWFDGCLWLRYIDPQYFMKRQLTPASDVYSYGVVLLELITGQRAINENNQGDELNNLVQWVYTYIHVLVSQSVWYLGPHTWVTNHPELNLLERWWWN
jgi:serine/threonine protein kinase